VTEFLTVNVNDHTEQKGKFTYLSWCWAWAEVLKADPEANWQLVEYGDDHGTLQPCMWLRDDTAVVKVNVTIEGKTRSAVLPVMNAANQAIKNPNAFQINTAVMRCLTKAIAMFGLGLYLYAGEDLPEGETPAPKPERTTTTPPAKEVTPTPPAAPKVASPMPTTADHEAYQRGMDAARARGLDTSYYAIDRDTTRAEMLDLSRKLKTALDEQAAAQTTMNGVV